MVKHIVLFKLKDTLSSDEKMQVMTSFKQAIEALPTQISVIRSIEVGFNINPAEAWDIALYSEFDSLDDVKNQRRFVSLLSHIVRLSSQIFETLHNFPKKLPFLQNLKPPVQSR